jgi:hypothetical protein
MKPNVARLILAASYGRPVYLLGAGASAKIVGIVNDLSSVVGRPTLMLSTELFQSSPPVKEIGIDRHNPYWRHVNPALWYYRYLQAIVPTTDHYPPQYQYFQLVHHGAIISLNNDGLARRYASHLPGGVWELHGTWQTFWDNYKKRLYWIPPSYAATVIKWGHEDEVWAEQTDEPHHSFGPKMVMPGEDEKYELSSQWWGAKGALETATALIVIGYSFPYYDNSVIDFLRQTLNSLPLENGIHIIDPLPVNIAADLRSWLGIKNIYTYGTKWEYLCKAILNVSSKCGFVRMEDLVRYAGAVQAEWKALEKGKRRWM